MALIVIRTGSLLSICSRPLGACPTVPAGPSTLIGVGLTGPEGWNPVVPEAPQS